MLGPYSVAYQDLGTGLVGMAMMNVGQMFVVVTET